MTVHNTDRSDDLPRQPSGNWSPDAHDIEAILVRADVRGLDLLPSGSNYVFVMALDDDTAGAGIAIYKPERGEAPLHDFPDGTLYRRERAAYLVSEALGWRLVPPTVVRDGPHGVGTAQLFIEHQARGSYFSMKDSRVAELRRMATFDAFINNADRKGGHCLDGRDGRVWGIDHGLTFHRQDKLRTVIWDWAGDPIDAPHLDDVPAWCKSCGGAATWPAGWVSCFTRRSCGRCASAANGCWRTAPTRCHRRGARCRGRRCRPERVETR